MPPDVPAVDPVDVRLGTPYDEDVLDARTVRQRLVLPIHGVDARVQRAADEPLRVRRLPLQSRRPRSIPAKPLRLLLPEGDAVPVGLVVELRLGIGVASQVRGWFEATVLVQQRV